jgi:large subunit ribosomal protein L22
MSKAASPRRVAENEALARSESIRTSPLKLNLVAALIRGKPAGQALADLTYSRRRVAGEVKKVLQAAIANAENNHQLDVDKLYVSQATVGKSMVMKRFHTRGRGRSSRIEKFFSKLTVVVREREQQEKPARTTKPAGKKEAV